MADEGRGMAPEDTSGYSRKKRILKNTAANGLAQAATMVSTFVFLPLLIHAFGFSVYGVYTLYLAVNGYAVLLDLGVSATLTRIVAERTAKGDSDGVWRAVFSSATIYFALGLFTAAVLFALGLTTHSLFNLSGVEAQLLKTLLWMGAAFQLWYWPTAAARDALAGLQRYDLIAKVTLGIVASDIVATIYILATGEGPLILVAARMVTMVVASLIHIGLLVRHAPKRSGALRTSGGEIRSILKSGSSVFALQIAGIMSRQQTDKLVLGVFLGTSAVTLYEIGAKLNSLITSFSGLSVSATLPVAAELNAQNRHASLLSLFLRGTKIVATLVVPIIVILVAMAGPFINAWFGPGFETAVPVAQLLLLSQVLLPLYLLGDQILIGKNKFSLWVPGGITLAILNVVLSVVLVRGFGLIGVALGTLIAYTLELPWYMRVFGKEMDLGARRWLASTAWPTYPLLVLPAAIAYFGSSTALGDSFPGLAVVGALALFAYWFAMLFLGYSSGERAGMLAFARSLTRRRSA